MWEIMEAVISESLFEKQKSSFDMLNRSWVFILLFSDIILLSLINKNNNNKKQKMIMIVIKKAEVVQFWKLFIDHDSFT